MAALRLPASLGGSSRAAVPSPYARQLARFVVSRHEAVIAGTATAWWEYDGPDAAVADAPALVFVHGFRGDHHGLEPIVAHLPGARVLVPDLPGFGASAPLERATVEGFAAWLQAFVTAVSARLGTAPVVLGHSFGSIVVAHAAARGLESVPGIVLVNPIATPALGEPGTVSGQRLASLVALGYYRVAAALPERAGHALLSSPVIVRGMSEAMAKTRDRALRRWIHDQHDRYFSAFAGRAAVLSAFETSIAHTVGEVAARIRTPVQLIVGDRDDITPLRAQHALRRAMPDARLSVLPGVGHLVHYERPREAAAIIRRFLAELDARAAGSAA